MPFYCHEVKDEIEELWPKLRTMWLLYIKNIDDF